MQIYDGSIAGNHSSRVTSFRIAGTVSLSVRQTVKQNNCCLTQLYLKSKKYIFEVKKQIYEMVVERLICDSHSSTKILIAITH